MEIVVHLATVLPDPTNGTSLLKGCTTTFPLRTSKPA